MVSGKAAGDRNLGVLSVEEVFEAQMLAECPQGLSAGREEAQGPRASRLWGKEEEPAEGAGGVAEGRRRMCFQNTWGSTRNGRGADQQDGAARGPPDLATRRPSVTLTRTVLSSVKV